MLPLDEWDVEYLVQEVASSTESATLEKKASPKFAFDGKGKVTAETRDELAKQVSAFSNSGNGFLVYGISDEGALDEGVPATVGNQSIKDWVEARIPDLLRPQVDRSEARFIHDDRYHEPDRGVLVVFVPLSERRPHWLDASERAFIRAGAHSEPMRTQTLFDIAGRSSAHVFEIGNLTAENIQSDTTWNQIAVFPTIMLVSGLPCREWAYELKLDEPCKFTGSIDVAGTTLERNLLSIVGMRPILPHQHTRVIAEGNGGVRIKIAHGAEGGFKLVATVFAGPVPTSKTYAYSDLIMTKR